VTTDSQLEQRLQRGLAGRYELLSGLGEGGMSVVFLARDLALGRKVAIKVLRPELSTALVHDRFLREIDIAANLVHPNIVPLHERGEAEGLLFYTMPFVEGESLEDRLDREGPLPLEDVLSILRDIADALDYAHGEGVLHRDIKPANIMLSHGHALVADFGVALAMSASTSPRATGAGMVVGTPAYMSPEQIAGDELDLRSDLYALGCVTFAMLTGRPPFLGGAMHETLRQHLGEAPPRLRALRPEIPSSIETAVGGALAKAPADRYGSSSEFFRAVEAAAHGGRSGTTRRLRARRLRRVLVAAASMATLAIAAIIALSPPRIDPTRVVLLTTSAGRLPPRVVALVRQALGEWNGLSLAESEVVERAVRGTAPITPEKARSTGRRLGAGKVFWLEAAGDTARSGLRIRLFEGGSGAGGVRDVPAPTRESIGFAVAQLFAGTSISEGLGATRGYEALRAAVTGDSLLSRWELDPAIEAYRRAIAADPRYALPRLRLARLDQWRDVPSGTWVELAETALRTGGALSASEQLEAQALAAYARGEFPIACGRYQQIVNTDSSSFVGWYGLAVCQLRDETVIPDPRSPSRYRFRASYHRGLMAHRRALQLQPLAHLVFGGPAVGKLVDNLFAESNKIRGGYFLAGDSTVFFAAFADIAGDTLSFVPWPAAETFAWKHPVANRLKAMQEARKQLLEITAGWEAQYPRSEPALLAHAVALELNGRVASASPEEHSALGILERVETLHRGQPVPIPILADKVRLLVKSGRFIEATAVAESALALPAAAGSDGVLQAGLAALLGRVFLAANLLGRYGLDEELTDQVRGTTLTAPPGLRVSRQRMLTFGAFAAPAESLSALTATVDAQLAGRDSAARASFRRAILRFPSLYAFPVMPPLSPADDPFETAQIERAIWAGDTVSARHLLAGVDAQRRDLAPWEVSLDILVLESRLRMMVGDTAAAAANLGAALGDLTLLSRDLLRVSHAAVLGQAAVLLFSASHGGQGRDLARGMREMYAKADPPAHAVRDRLAAIR